MIINKTMPEINQFIRWWGWNFSSYKGEDKQTHYVFRFNGLIDWFIDIYIHLRTRIFLKRWDW
jgi:hypothetical protein